MNDITEEQQVVPGSISMLCYTKDEAMHNPKLGFILSRGTTTFKWQSILFLLALCCLVYINAAKSYSLLLPQIRLMLFRHDGINSVVNDVKSTHAKNRSLLGFVSSVQRLTGSNIKGSIFGMIIDRSWTPVLNKKKLYYIQDLLFQEAMESQSTQTIKIPILQPGEYDLWKIKMEQYLQCIDYTLWEIIENGNGPIVTKTIDGKETVIPPASVEEKAQRRA
ncbi:hypothetical protein Tco_1166224 [Tanacetum coccineum]